jgi:hypothetical protein
MLTGETRILASETQRIAVRNNWKRIQSQFEYPVNPIGVRIDTRENTILKEWKDEGIYRFMKEENLA